MVLCLQSCLRFTRGGFCRKDAQRRQCYFCRTVARLRDFAWFVLTLISACGTHRLMWKGKCQVFKRRLAAVLAVRGMGQREFATFCKVTPRAVRNWLSGRPPSPTVFALISSAWGEDTFLYLVGDIDRMPEPQPEPVRVVEEV